MATSAYHNDLDADEATYSSLLPISPPSRPFAPSPGTPVPQPGSLRDSASSFPTYTDTNRNSTSTPSAGLLPAGAAAAATHDGAPLADSDAANTGRKRRGFAFPRTRRALLTLLALLLILLILVIALPVALTRHHHSSNTASSGGGGENTGGTGDSGGDGGGGDGGGGGNQNSLIVGGDGSTVTTDDGESFVYNNSFGGFWVSSSANSDPFHPTVAAQPNSWTPPLNQSWVWGRDRVYGVNLGGWFVLEPFIAPSLFQPYPSASDEWSLSTLMRADGTLQQKLEAHYASFITERDIAQIAGAGLNWVRVPIPFWAVSTWPNTGVEPSGSTESEPFLAGVAWPYIVRLLNWARKYGIRVNLDLHTVPGSQNGFNHSGKGGQVNFLNGIMGIANAQRTLDYIRIITEFVSQPEWRDVVGMFGIVNEAREIKIGQDQLSAFYLEAHNMIRSITGIGTGPYISIHDGFLAVSAWSGFLPGSDRIVMDTHPYFAFSGNPQTEPISTGTDPDDAGGQWPRLACNSWGSSLNNSRKNFGVTIAGEFSNGYNDCGLFLNGVNGTHSFGGDCDDWQDSSNWDDGTKAGVKAFAMASMDALGDWFFWTWKIGPALDGVVRSPLWSYQLGLENGWIPTDPRTAVGKCAALGVQGSSFSGTFSSWQTGGAGAGTIAAAATRSFGQWPPATLSNVDEDAMTLLPTYTPTGAVPTLTYTTPTPAGSVTGAPTVSVGDGWFDKGDTAGYATTVAGCTYPAAWSALDLPMPTERC
ncbi:glycoside hydrolase family 5 protein [Favolaschia claudopus]|uniref:glucan 1,3-beta-glucosidase n=1 Tax=Favolaschia claudopus TaxID=2862362 RepID=A0AAV9ZDX9_9AGAR